MSRSDLLIDVRDLAKSYRSIRAVDGISFQVRRGDVLGFLGPNGAGKTTAMRMITGFIDPDRGSAAVLARAAEISTFNRFHGSWVYKVNSTTAETLGLRKKDLIENDG